MTNSKIQLGVAASAVMSIIVLTSFEIAWAEPTTSYTTFTILASDDMKKNPVAMKILQNIEIFKQQYAALQQKQHLAQQENKLIAEKRQLANQYLQKDLAALNNQNIQHTPKNAFASFVTQVDQSKQSLFWDEFNFMEQRTQKAQEAMMKVLRNGGNLHDALKAYHDVAASQKAQLVDFNKNLNIKYHFADQKTQSVFDKLGTIPRN